MMNTTPESGPVRQAEDGAVGMLPVLWRPREPGPIERQIRLAVAVVITCCAFFIGLTTFLTAYSVRSVLDDSACGRGGTSCSLEESCEPTETSLHNCAVLNGRAALDQHGLLDDAERLYYPKLIALRYLPIGALLAGSLTLLPPPRFRKNFGTVVLVVVLGIAGGVIAGQVIYSDSIGYASDIVD